jgi:hypothetical protein
MFVFWCTLYHCIRFCCLMVCLYLDVRVALTCSIGRPDGPSNSHRYTGRHSSHPPVCYRVTVMVVQSDDNDVTE